MTVHIEQENTSTEGMAAPSQPSFCVNGRIYRAHEVDALNEAMLYEARDTCPGVGVVSTSAGLHCPRRSWRTGFFDLPR